MNVGFRKLLLLAITFALVLVPSIPKGSPAHINAPSLLQLTSNGHVLGFESRGVYAATGSHALRVDFLRAQRIEPQTDSGDVFRRVLYAELWEGIDLEYASNTGGIYTTTYTLAPGANAKHIRLRYNAPLTLNENGTLTIAFENGAFTESAPIAWQEINGARVPVQVAFRVRGREVGFALGAYDPQVGVTIDPSLVWNTFLGSAALDWNYGLTRDGSGNIYVTGYSAATWGTPVRSFTAGANDCSVAKLDEDGSLLWNTFLGSSGSDECRDIVYNGSEILVVGYSNATWGSPTRAYSSGYDTMVAKLNASTGALIWNSFLGGSGADYGRGVSFASPGGYVYVAGYSNATWGTSPKRTYTAGDDGFAAKLDSTGALVWHAFLGGSGSDYGRDIHALSAFAIYAVGVSDATWSAPTIAHHGGKDAYIVLLDSNGLMSWLSFLGGSGDDYGNAIHVSSAGSEYVLGGSTATWGSPVRAFSGASEDVFIARVGASGTLTWNTFLGGGASDVGYAITADGSGNVYAAGNSSATWGSPLEAYAGAGDAFVAKVTSAGALVSNTFAGSVAGYDTAHGIAVDSSGDAYVSGASDTTWGSPIRTFSADDVFVAKVDVQRPTVSSFSFLDSNPTDKATVEYQVNFSEPVTDVLIADFGLATTGTVTGASITALGCSGSICTAYINTGSGDGTLHLRLMGWATIYDFSGNAMTALPYMDGPTYTVDKSMVFRSAGAQDGWVLESTETSNTGGSLDSSAVTLRLGDDAGNRQYRSLLSFNTTALPDTAVITRVTLKIRQSGAPAGTNPFTILGALRVDIRMPFFGTAAGLAVHDFQGAAGMNNIGTIPNAPVSSWYTRVWSTDTFFSFINRTGTTQFRLRFSTDDNNNNGADLMSFISGNHATASVRPTLIIEYYVP